MDHTVDHEYGKESMSEGTVHRARWGRKPKCKQKEWWGPRERSV